MDKHLGEHLSSDSEILLLGTYSKEMKIHSYSGRLIGNKNELLIHATIRLDLKNTVLSKIKPDTQSIYSMIL